MRVHDPARPDWPQFVGLVDLQVDMVAGLRWLNVRGCLREVARTHREATHGLYLAEPRLHVDRRRCREELVLDWPGIRLRYIHDASVRPMVARWEYALGAGGSVNFSRDRWGPSS